MVGHLNGTGIRTPFAVNKPRAPQKPACDGTCAGRPKLCMHLTFRWGDLLRAECWRYEAQIKPIYILSRGRANATRLAHADGYVDDLLCHDSRFRAAPRRRPVVILREKLRRGRCEGYCGQGRLPFFKCRYNPPHECPTDAAQEDRSDWSSSDPGTAYVRCWRRCRRGCHLFTCYQTCDF